MKLTQESKGDVYILRLAGQLVGGPEGDSLRDSISGALEQGFRKILIDLGEVSWVNSTGLGILILGHLKASSSGARLVLAGASRRIDSIFQVTRLNTVFHLLPDEESALLKMAG